MLLLKISPSVLLSGLTLCFSLMLMPETILAQAEDSSDELSSEELSSEEVSSEEVSATVHEGLRELTQEELANYEFDVTEDPAVISELSVGQRYTMNRNRTAIEDLVARHLGILTLKQDKRDLVLMQKLVDQKFISLDDTETLQSLGVLFGDIIAKEMDLHWVSYEDELGSSKALRWKKTENYVFPVSMFSKRARHKQDIDLLAVFSKISEDVDSFKAYEAARARFD